MASLIQWTSPPGDSEGQGTLVCCSPWGHKESDTAKQQKNSSRGSSQLRDQTQVFCTGRRVLYHWATREAQWTAYMLAPLAPNLWELWATVEFLQQWILQEKAVINTVTSEAGVPWSRVFIWNYSYDLKLNIQKTKIMTSGPIISWQIDGETVETVTDFILGDSKITADDDCSHDIKWCLLLGRKAMTNIDSILKSRDITLPTKAHLSQSYGFSSSHVWMWELDYKESWALKNWCFWTVVLEKTLESPLDCKEIQPVHPEWNQFRIFIGRTDVEAETPILWPPDVKSWLIWKGPDAGKDWGQEEKGTTEDEMVG